MSELNKPIKDKIKEKYQHLVCNKKDSEIIKLKYKVNKIITELTRIQLEYDIIGAEILCKFENHTECTFKKYVERMTFNSSNNFPIYVPNNFDVVIVDGRKFFKHIWDVVLLNKNNNTVKDIMRYCFEPVIWEMNEDMYHNYKRGYIKSKVSNLIKKYNNKTEYEKLMFEYVYNKFCTTLLMLTSRVIEETETVLSQTEKNDNFELELDKIFDSYFMEQNIFFTKTGQKINVGEFINEQIIRN